MSKSDKKKSGGGQIIDGKRQTMFLVDPDDVVIIGIDTKDGPEHPLHDKRALVPPSDGFVRNLITYGNLEPVIVRKNGDKTELVDGRTRTLGGRLAKKIMHDRGDGVFMLKAIFQKGDDKKMVGIMVSANEQRRDDDALSRAAKAQRMHDLGSSEEEIMEAFDWSAGTLRNHLALLDLDPKIQSAISTGKIGAIAASKLADFPRDKQVAEFDRLAAEGKLSIAEVSARVQNEKRGSKSGNGNGNGNGDGGKKPTKHVPPSRTVLRKVAKAAQVIPEGSKKPEIELSDDALAILRWTIGEVSLRAIPGLGPKLRQLGIINEE